MLLACHIDNNNPLHACIADIESKYKGLGIPVTYGILSVLANKSVFFIAGRGVGKTRVISSIPHVEDHFETKFDTFTYGELDTLCQSLAPNQTEMTENYLGGVENKKLVFIVKEFSTLSEYHREVFLTVCSRVALDGDYTHITTVTPHLRFENCKLSMLVAIQPRLYSQLCNRYTQWENMSSDRFTKFLLLNPLRQNITIDEQFVATLPREIPNAATLQNGLNMEKLVNLFEGQISGGRAYIYARDYAMAFARLQGKTEVTQEDNELFYRLFSPYLQSFTILQERANLEASVTVSSGNIELLVEIGKYPEGIAEGNLALSLMVTTRHIERGLGFLLAKDLIAERDNRYYLNDELQEFFTWYRDTLCRPNVAGE